MDRHKDIKNSYEKNWNYYSARINSIRLRGKVLKYLDNKTLIEWVIKRLKKTKIKNIILATGNLKENLKLKKICDQENIKFLKEVKQMF